MNFFSVGLVWETGNYDKRRCIPFEQLSPLFDVHGINLYIFQANAKALGWKQGYGTYPGDCSLTEYAARIKA